MNLYHEILRFIETLHRRKFELYLKSLVDRGLSLGKNVRILDGCFLDPSHCFLISIGDNTVICPNVRLIAHDASTKMALGYSKIGKIEIQKNCFVGDSAIILPGVTIGANSIIGAGSVVTKDVPSGMVVAGAPAKVISSVEEYTQKIESKSSGRKIFGTEYYITRLDDKKRKEILKEVQKEIGFIV